MCALNLVNAEFGPVVGNTALNDVGVRKMPRNRAEALCAYFASMASSSGIHPPFTFAKGCRLLRPLPWAMMI
jgi:hypothetical protein